jgi:predicted adenylyl cyclase CyaB
MAFINVEIKARTSNAIGIRKILQDNNADFRGIDHQTDTYFNVPNGRLKLRQGNIENTLIQYERANFAGPKTSNFNVMPVADGPALKEILKDSLGIKVVVDKQREIYFIGNVKFHLDQLQSLGSFVEIEASNKYADLDAAALNAQCNYYIQLFGIATGDMVTHSYSDLLLGI